LNKLSEKCSQIIFFHVVNGSTISSKFMFRETVSEQQRRSHAQTYPVLLVALFPGYQFRLTGFQSVFKRVVVSHTSPNFEIRIALPVISMVTDDPNLYAS
jgi:hypothetical protein